MKTFTNTLVISLIFTNSLTLVMVAMFMEARSDSLNEIKELKIDVAMYESVAESLILTNREQHNMLLECMKGDKK